MAAIKSEDHLLSDILGVPLLEQSGQEIFEELELAFWVYDFNNVDSWNSSGIEKISGYAQEEFQQTPSLWINSIVHPLDRERVRATYIKLKETESFHTEYRIVCKNGEVKWIQEKAVVITRDGTISHNIGIIEDITNRKLIETELQQSELKYRSLVENSAMGVYIIKNNHFHYVNPRILEMTGYTEEEFTTLPFDFLLDEEGKEIARQRIYNYKQGYPNIKQPQIFKIRKKDGQNMYVELRSTLIQSDSDFIVSGSVLDITERKKSEETIQYLAYFEPQTGLRTRSSFYEQLDKAIMQKQDKLLVMFIDLDKFKMINDQYGHHAGDELIREVSRKILDFVGNRGEAGRYGGDEFVLFLSVDNVDPERIMLLASYLHNEISSVSMDGVKDLPTIPSIGISIYPDHGRTSDELIRYADTAMYFAKKISNEHFKIFTAELDQIGRRKAKLTQDLNAALEKGEFFLVYQPIFSLTTREIKKNEALVRWRHSELGLINPDEFIPIAEESGLINKLGDWVLETACRQTALWQQQGFHDLKVSVNISARQLKQDKLIEKLAAILEVTGLASRDLNLEITESASIHNVAYTLPILKGIKELGISLSLDDFGTGYSSLSYLSQLPFDHLKIDKSFIMQMEENPHNKPIVNSILSVAESLNLQTVAEGVEKEEHLNFLQSMGCKLAQGFFLSRPLPVEEIEFFMENTKNLA